MLLTFPYVQSYGVSVENILCVETNAGPSYDDIKKMPNKVLLWCGEQDLSSYFRLVILDAFSKIVRYLLAFFLFAGTRSSNLLRHVHKGFLPAICSMPAPGYMVS